MGPLTGLLGIGAFLLCFAQAGMKLKPRPAHREFKLLFLPGTFIGGTEVHISIFPGPHSVEKLVT